MQQNVFLFKRFYSSLEEPGPREQSMPLYNWIGSMAII